MGSFILGSFGTLKGQNKKEVGGEGRNLVYSRHPVLDLNCYLQQIPCSIYGVHDEAKDKDFELEMSWVCDESNRQHVKVILSSYILATAFSLATSCLF